jgi:hypothetical protein
MSTKPKNDLNLDEQYKNMVQSVETQEVYEPEVQQQTVQETPLNLGKVNMERFTGERAEDADFHLGYHLIPLLSLPSGGMFYPEGTQLSIRSAKVAEVRQFSTIDESNVLDIDDKLNEIVDSCTRIICTSKRLSYKDLLEEDRFYVILSIRDLTFPEPESNLKIDHTSKKGEKHDIEIKKEYFQYFKIPTELDKYYDSDRKSFMIETRSFGTIEMIPPAIGVMQKITSYIKEKQQKNIKIDQSVLQIIPYLHRDWRNFNDKTIFEFEMDLNGWSNKKYNLVYTLAEKMKVGIQPNMLVQLGDEEEEVPISFRDGIKSLFVVQDIAGELL